MTREFAGALAGTLILVAAVLGVAAWGAAGEAAPNAQNPNVLGFSAPASQSDLVAIVWVYRDGSQRTFALVEDVPTVTPTATPLPSMTPIPTNTTRPTATDIPQPTIEPSPTPEVTTLPTLGPPTLPPVPTATLTPTPQPGACTFTPVAGLNVRAAMWGQVIARFGYEDNAGTAPPTIGIQTLRAEARATDDQGDQWVAFWLDADTFGWVHGDYVTLAGACDELPVTPSEVLIGPHMLFNASAGTLWPLLDVAGVAKEVSGDGKLLTMARAANPDVVTVYRYVDDVLGNCSPDWMDGRQWFDALYARWPRGFDWYEIENECGETSRAYSNTHVIETMERANEVGVCLILYSFSVGTPRVEFMKSITPALDYALAHECQPGRHHSIGMHAYGLGYPREDEWRFSLWKKLCGAVPGYCERLGVWFTEWEWYGEESDPVDCAQVMDNVRWALTEYKDTPIQGLMQWSYGPLPPWRDLSGCGGAVAAHLN